MLEQHFAKLKKVSDHILAELAEPGYYLDLENSDDDAILKLRAIEGFFDRLPKYDQFKPIAQAIRTGLLSRGYQVRGNRPGPTDRTGTLYYYYIRKS